MHIDRESQAVKNEIGAWLKEHTQIVPVSADTLEVATTEIDAYGDTVYCFVQKIGSRYRVSDGGNMLFKLDPGQEDQDLYQTAADIALGAGFDFDDQSCTISILTSPSERAQAIIKLAQLQVAISYLD